VSLCTPGLLRRLQEALGLTAKQAWGVLVHAVVRHSSESRMQENRTSGSMSGHGKPLIAVVGGRCVHRNHRERLQVSAHVRLY